MGKQDERDKRDDVKRTRWVRVMTAARAARNSDGL